MNPVSPGQVVRRADVRAAAEAEPAARDLDGLRALARLMDEAIRIPGTSLRVGLDGVLGLIPGVGDLAGGLVSAWFLVAAARLGASPSMLARMGLNLGLDALLGAIPVIGDLFDFAWKANRKNLTLLERHLEDPAGARRASRLVVVATVSAVLVLVGLVLVGAIAIATALVRWLIAVA